MLKCYERLNETAMIIDVKIPSPGESVTEVAIGNWLVENMDYVEKDQELAEVETDKATLPLISPEAGIIKILINPGQKIQVGDIACTIDTSAKPKSDKRRSATVKKLASDKTIETKPDSREHVHNVHQESMELREQTSPDYPNVKTTPVARLPQHLWLKSPNARMKMTTSTQILSGQFAIVSR